MAAIPTQEEPTTESLEPSEANVLDDGSDDGSDDISVAEITAASIPYSDAIDDNNAYVENLDSTTATWEEIEIHLEKKYGSKTKIKLNPTEHDTGLLIDFISRAEFEEDEEAAQEWLAKFVKFNDAHPTLTRKSERTTAAKSLVEIEKSTMSEPVVAAGKPPALKSLVPTGKSSKSTTLEPSQPLVLFTKKAKGKKPTEESPTNKETKSLSESKIAFLRLKFEEKYKAVYNHQNTDKNR